MKLWIIGLLLLGIVIPLINGQDLDDDVEDYEVKRFHVQSRQLNGRSTCIETRRKRSALEVDDDSEASNDDDDEQDSMDDEMEISIADDGREEEDATGILIRDTDLAGNAGILVIQNGVSPNTPFLFELRPVQPDKKEAYFQVVSDDSDGLDDPNFGDDIDNMENNDNRFEPDSDLDSDEYEDSSPSRPPKPKRKRPSSQESDENMAKPIKKKPKRPSSQPLRNKRKPNRKNNKTKNKNKNKKSKNKNKKKRKNSKRPGTSSASSLRRKGNKRLGTNIKQGSGMRTVTNTVTTTQTGPGAGDMAGVNCIIINKPSMASPTQRPFWNILGRSAGERQTDRSFGLRKRITQKLFRRE